jgi:hypothetical protein
MPLCQPHLHCYSGAACPVAIIVYEASQLEGSLHLAKVTMQVAYGYEPWHCW